MAHWNRSRLILLALLVALIALALVGANLDGLDVLEW
jgi:hypothetical protein